MPTCPCLLLSIAFLFFFIPSGCENVALFPRPDIDRTTGLPRTDISRDVPEPERKLLPDEITGIVDRIDDAHHELYLRMAGGQTDILKYDSHTLVASGNGDLSLASLRPGDRVRVRLSRGGAGEYADFIRIERLETRSSRY